MAITSYPRVTLQGSGPSQNPQNGTGLMVLNPSTNKYEAVTSATFSGGGGSATSANQTEQINIATESNGFLDTILNSGLYYDGNYVAEMLYSTTASKSTAELLNDINNTLALINTELGNINNELISLNSAITDGTQLVQITDSAGIKALVDATDKALNVKSF